MREGLSHRALTKVVTCAYLQTESLREMAEPPKLRGHFIINVAEASGKNKEDQLVWDPNFVEGFVKGKQAIC